MAALSLIIEEEEKNYNNQVRYPTNLEASTDREAIAEQDWAEHKEAVESVGPLVELLQGGLHFPKHP